jgi:aryl-alcohol dehydrogenase-like predicted oxidoreductase
VVAIPGTTSRRHLETNLGAMGVALTEDDLALLEPLSGKVLGDRYNAAGMATLDR